MMGTLITLLLLGMLARALWGRRGGGAHQLADALARAEAAGIITGEQRARILDQAAARPHGPRLGGTAWLAVFAGLFVLAGVSLLVAHNWEAIGPAVRVAAFLAVLALAGEATVRSHRRTLAVSVPLELVWLFLPLLGIGLYGQTFQLSGDPIRPFLVWLALTLPLAWLSPRPFVAALHTLALVAVLFTGNFGTEGMLSLLRQSAGAAPVGIGLWMLSAALLALVAVQSLRLLPPGHRHHFLGVVAAWVYALLMTPTALRLEHPGWLGVAAVAIATLWLATLLATDASMAERTTGALVWLGTVYALTFSWHASHAFEGATTPGGVALTLVALVAALGTVAALPARRLGVEGVQAGAAKVLLGLPAVLSLLLLTDNARVVHQTALLMNVFLVGIAIALMWQGSLARQVARVNLGVLVLLVVLVTRFLDVFGSLLQGGVGFIVAGILLALLAWALDRARRRLLQTPEEAAS